MYINPEKKVVEISPIHEMISGHTVKVQVRLDEDASDQEILSTLDDACRQWGGVQRIEMELRLLVGRLLVAVREREIHKQEEWGSFERFLDHIETTYGIKRTSATDAIIMVESLPGVSTKRAKAIGPTNLLLVARAVRRAPERKRDALAETLLAEADEKPAVDVFRERLKNAKLLRTGRMRRRLARIVLEVPIAVADAWRELVGERNSAEVFAELIQSRSRKSASSADSRVA